MSVLIYNMVWTFHFIFSFYIICTTLDMQRFAWSCTYLWTKPLCYIALCDVVTRYINSPVLLPKFLFADERNLSRASEVVQTTVDIDGATVLSRIRGVTTIVIGLICTGPPVEAGRIQRFIWKYRASSKLSSRADKTWWYLLSVTGYKF